VWSRRHSDRTPRPGWQPDELAPGTVELPRPAAEDVPGSSPSAAPGSVDLRSEPLGFDICFAQTNSLLLEFGIWLRQMKGIPLLCVNTTHLVAAYDVLLPEKLSKNEMLQAGVHLTLTRPFEKLFSNIYNQSDGLVVLSEGLRSYWRERGVTAPIHVIPRTVQPDVFDRPLGDDPYTHLVAGAMPQGGPRLMCAGRHTREKAQDRVIRIFARHVLPHAPDATLTLVGDGPDTPYYRRVARELGADHRVFFTSEVPWTTMPDFYRYADVFVHASLSEDVRERPRRGPLVRDPGRGVRRRDGRVLADPGRGQRRALRARQGRGRRGRRGRRLRARRRRADSRPAGAGAPRQSRQPALARAVLALRGAAAHRGRLPARTGPRGGLRPPARRAPTAPHAVAHDVPPRPSVDDVQRSSSTSAVTSAPPRV